MTTKTDDQERADFEAWAASIGFCVTGKYAETVDVLCAKSAFKAGYQASRAALQSQDQEDADRYRWLRDRGVTSFPKVRDWMTVRIISTMPECISSLDEAIDHARRIEGGGE